MSNQRKVPLNRFQIVHMVIAGELYSCAVDVAFNKAFFTYLQPKRCGGADIRGTHTHTREYYRKPAHARRDLIKVRAFSVLYANVF